MVTPIAHVCRIKFVVARKSKKEFYKIKSLKFTSHDDSYINNKLKCQSMVKTPNLSTGKHFFFLSLKIFFNDLLQPMLLPFPISFSCDRNSPVFYPLDTYRS